MNYVLHTASEQFLCQMNNSVVCLQTQEKTLTNDMKNFQELQELYYDIRHTRVSNKASLDPSVTLEKELKVMYEHLISTINQFYTRQRKRLLDIHSRLLKEEFEHPQVDTVKKIELKTFFSRATLFVEHVELLLV